MSAMVLKRFFGLVAVLSLTAVPYMAWPIFEDFDDPLEPGAWSFQGSASQDQTQGLLEITPASNNQTGAAWLNETIDCTQFRASFKFWIGDGNGADGLVFAWVREQGMGGGGGSLGWYGGGLTGYGIVFDTYPTPAVNQVSFEDPEVHTGSDTGGFVSYEPPVDMDNAGGWFDVEVEMDNGHLRVWMTNEAEGFAKTLAIDYTLAGYQGFDAYFGFTGATGGLNNNHWVDDLAINMGADAGPDQVVESGDEVTLDGSKSVNAIGFLWDQVGGEPVGGDN